MKKYIYIFCVALLAAACVEPLEKIDAPLLDDGENGPLVMVEFSIPSQPRTKAMDEKPAIQRMHVAVFNASGYLKEFKEASLTSVGTVNAGDAEARDTYSVQLQMASSKRILHFIANSPVTSKADLTTTTGESNVMMSLITQYPDDAYWQRLVLTGGITAYKYPGGKLDDEFLSPTVVATYYKYESGAYVKITDDDYSEAVMYSYSSGGHDYKVYVDDYIRKDGTKITDDSGFIADATVAGAVATVPLIRNFARVRVNRSTGASPDFIPIAFTLLNIPSHGYVAPYDNDAEEFVEKYQNATSRDNLTYTAIHESHYAAPMPAGASLESFTENTDFLFVPPYTTMNPGAPINDIPQVEGEYFYTYERPLPTSSQSPVYILVRGWKKMENNAYEKRWFKIELTDVASNYVPLYRGVTYEVTIAEISGSYGYETMADAIDNPPLGDISSSTVTENLTTIAKDGVTLMVQYIGNTHVGPATDTTLLYKFFKDDDPTDNALLTKDNVSLTLSHYTPGNPIAVTGTSTSTAYSGNGPDGKGGWYQVTVDLAATEEGATKLSDLIVTGTYTSGARTTTLKRTVKYAVLPVQAFQGIESTGLTTDVKGDQTTVSVKLPPNLPFSMFPLTLTFESNNNNLNPVDEMPVLMGTSLFKSFGSTDPNYRTTNAYYFTKTVNWKDYDPASEDNWVSATFKTTADGAVTGDNKTTVVAVGDKDNYFTPTKTTLFKSVFAVTPSDQTVKGSASQATFRIYGNENMISNLQWTITDLNGQEIRAASIPNVTPGSSTEATNPYDTEVTMSFNRIPDTEEGHNAPGNQYTAKVVYSYTDASNATQSGTVTVTVVQKPLEYVSKDVTKPFSITSSSPLTVTDDAHEGATVSLTRSGFIYNNDSITSNNNTSSLTFTPADGITIKGISLDWSNSSYHPNTITIRVNNSDVGSISTSGTSGSWSSETGYSSEVIANLQRRNRYQNFSLNTISISYSYSIWE